MRINFLEISLPHDGDVVLKLFDSEIKLDFKEIIILYLIAPSVTKKIV